MLAAAATTTTANTLAATIASSVQLKPQAVGRSS